MSYRHNSVEDEAIERIDSAREQAQTAEPWVPPTITCAGTAPLMSCLSIRSLTQLIGLCQNHGWEMTWLH